MDKNLPSFEVFRPFAFIPKEIRIIELVVVCVLFLFSIRKFLKKRETLSMQYSRRFHCFDRVGDKFGWIERFNSNAV